jgi:hypothetical protein
MVTTDPVQDVIAAGVLLTAIIGLFTHRVTKTVASKLEDTTSKLEEVIVPKLDEVHAMVNDQLSKAVERRDVSEAENVELRHNAESP